MGKVVYNFIMKKNSQIHWFCKNCDVHAITSTRCAAANSDLIMMGDFNSSGINWVTMKSDWRGQSLFELSQDLFLTQHVKDNTREDAVLDLIFSSEPGMIDNLVVREKFGEGFETYSDHRIITYDMILRT